MQKCATILMNLFLTKNKIYSTDQLTNGMCRNEKDVFKYKKEKETK